MAYLHSYCIITPINLFCVNNTLVNNIFQRYSHNSHNYSHSYPQKRRKCE